MPYHRYLCCGRFLVLATVVRVSIASNVCILLFYPFSTSTYQYLIAMKLFLALTSLLLVSSAAGADTFNIKFNLANLDGKKGMKRVSFFDSFTVFLFFCGKLLLFFFNFAPPLHSTFISSTHHTHTPFSLSHNLFPFSLSFLSFLSILSFLSFLSFL